MNEDAESQPAETLLPGMYFRPSADIRQGIERIARAERRSLSNAVLALLSEALANRKRKKAA